MTIDCVLFDLDGVLVEYRRDVRCRVLAERIGSDEAAVQTALFDSGLETLADLGRIGAVEQARALGDALGVPVAVEDCVAARAAAMTPDLALTATLDALACRVGLAILTNNGVLVRDHFETLCPPFARHFAGRVHCSAMYGALKPDPVVFTRCAAALDTAPERVLFVDDLAENVQGARASSMAAHHYKGRAGLLEELRGRALAGGGLPA